MRFCFLLLSLAALLLCAPVAHAQMTPPPALQDPLLEHMVGDWTLTGAIMDKPTTHKVHVEWILQHHYLHLTDVSNEKNPNGGAQYEADAEIGWDEKDKRYDCLWLDIFGTNIMPIYIGHARAKPNKIPFIFNYGDTVFHNDFTYVPTDDKWTWKMDSVKDGKVTPVGFVTLVRTK